jgi:predicted ATPase
LPFGAPVVWLIDGSVFGERKRRRFVSRTIFNAMVKNRGYVITGAFGSGKSTLLECLRLRGLQVIGEPARPILAEQRSIEGSGVPEKDPRLFIELMLSRMLSAYAECDTAPGPIIFDRGIPDLLAYAKLFGFEFPAAENAAILYRYNPDVFVAAPWEQIYCTDEERTVPFSVASEFGENVRAIYERLGYTLIDLPRVSAAERADFVLQLISA